MSKEPMKAQSNSVKPRPANVDYMLKDAKKVLALTGEAATIEQISKVVGMSQGRVRDWVTRYDSFAEAVKTVQDTADDRVVSSLYDKCIGRMVTESKDVISKGKAITLTTTRWVAGDVVAMIFWLKNRRPDAWKNMEEKMVANIQVNVVGSGSRGKKQVKSITAKVT
jgi:hypothetical protein